MKLIIVSAFMMLLSLSVNSFTRLSPARLNSRSFAVSKKVSRRMNMQATQSLAPVRVRFAPSPTGSLHVGGARTALFNWLLAKKTNGKFIIRVEDTDEARSTRQSERSILNDVKWMNMMWDEGPEIGGACEPYRQSERKDIYKKFAEQLIAAGKAFRCFCSEEELDLKRQQAEDAGIDTKYDGTWADADPAVVAAKVANGDPYTVRFRVPKGKIVSFDDIVRDTVTWDADAMLGDFIILRSSGMPVYNFCVAVDDATMGITHVIRAEEHLSNTLRQLLILEALDYKPPTYAHCSLILGSDRSKLSKRHGATSVQQFAEQGFLPNAMMNYLANLGWNDGTDKEIYTPDELIKAFDLSRIVKSSAVFDMDKLRWINGQHIRLMPIDELQPLVISALQKPSAAGVNDAILPSEVDTNKLFVKTAMKIAQRDMELIADARKIIGTCLQYSPMETIKSDPHAADILTEEAERVIKFVVADYEANALPLGLEENFSELWKAYLKKVQKELGIKGKALFHPIRFAITGRMSGPDIGEQMVLIASAVDSGAVNAEYKVVALAERISFLKSFTVAEAKKILELHKEEQLLLVQKEQPAEQIA